MSIEYRIRRNSHDIFVVEEGMNIDHGILLPEGKEPIIIWYEVYRACRLQNVENWIKIRVENEQAELKTEESKRWPENRGKIIKVTRMF
jgi:hypothetical protein